MEALKVAALRKASSRIFKPLPALLANNDGSTVSDSPSVLLVPPCEQSTKTRKHPSLSFGAYNSNNS
jgi:hypothetical protein